ncbi:16S rRNA processing protein RimM [Natranaerovirga hydrolytica]|uniref:Ribosome maturation factor RimM n=1 Tax=Natranaerovirga hydrolytica TaxID=680378 RepID=A0A4R1MYT0_9FIRM|nr:ribosome maturation factor RimM [Natranaerovirga hydrolytica]TCK98305.1 16S rRNA processing protein RimM [Natranaerovirga hydrolytica]
MTEFFQIGIITNTHGIKGELKVLPTTDDPERFELLDWVIVDNKKENIELQIEKVRYFKKQVILKFKAYDSINHVEKFKNAIIKIPRELALPLEEDEYYISDLIGLEVFTDQEEKLGHLKDVIKTGSNEVYIIQTKDDKEILLPAIKECILDINLKDKKIKVHLMKGLVD